MYQSDLSNEELKLICHHFEPKDRRGSGYKHPRKLIVDSILYVVKGRWGITPCWAMLVPRAPLPENHLVSSSSPPDPNLDRKSEIPRDELARVRPRLGTARPLDDLV
jgi:hypothetical protein